MNVYVIRTQEFEMDKFIEVKDFLTSFEGAVEFHFSDYNQFTTDKFPFLIKAEDAEDINAYYKDFVGDDNEFKWYARKMRVSIEERKRYQCLTFDEIFSLCDYYRNNLKISKDDFVVILTKWNNEYNFFSSYDGRGNIFVNGNNWEEFAGQANSKYPIAYEIIQNIISTLMRIEFDPHKFIDICAKKYNDAADLGKYETTHYSPYIHESPRGCINDLCRRKEHIINKLRSGTICPECAAKMAIEKIDGEIQYQLFSMLSAISEEFKFKCEKPNPTSVDPPYRLMVDSEKRIWILTEKEKVEIKIPALFKTLYIFFLRHEQGCKAKDLTDHKQELLNIYSEMPSMKKGIDEAERTVKSSLIGEGFSSAVSKINTIISELITNPALADYYTIQGERMKPYAIKIPRKFVDIRI